MSTDVLLKRVLVAPEGTHGFDSPMICCGEGEVRSLVSTLFILSIVISVKLSASLIFYV